LKRPRTILAVLGIFDPMELAPQPKAVRELVVKIRDSIKTVRKCQ